MWKDLWRILSHHESLLDEARSECLQMLDLAEDMYDVVLQAMVEQVHEGILERIAKMDRVLNERQRDVRKKVFEHLAVSKAQDLLTGLILTSVVIDLERVGDYTKNIGELVAFVPGRLEFGRYSERYASIATRTRELFGRTREVFTAWDAEAAREHVAFYDQISKDSDGLLMELMKSGAPGETIEKSMLGLALLLRYVKRVAAHLKNICTAISNPFPAIGYRPI